MTRLLFVLPLFFGAIALAGCSYTPGHAEPDRLTDAQYPQIVTLGWLRNDFFFSPPVVTPEDGGRPMSVSVGVRLKENAWEKDIPCQYRFIFLDGAGVPLDPDPTWQYRNVPPRVKVTLQGNAPDIGAVDWQCEIREDKVDRNRKLRRRY